MIDQPEDTYDDLKFTRAPIYVYDTILGLRSADKDRYESALKSVLTISDKVADIDVQGEELLETLIRCQNKFGLEEFN